MIERDWTPEQLSAWLESATREDLLAENRAIEVGLTATGPDDYDEAKRLGRLRALVCSELSRRAKPSRRRPRREPKDEAEAKDAEAGRREADRVSRAEKERRDIAHMYRRLYADVSRSLSPAPSDTPETYSERVRKWVDSLMAAAANGERDAVNARAGHPGGKE